MNKQRKQQFLDAAVDDFLKKQGLREDDIILRRPAEKGVLCTIFCFVCGAILAGLVYDGAKWVWKNYVHKCPGPVQPPEQQPVQPPEQQPVQPPEQYTRICPFLPGANCS